MLIAADARPDATDLLSPALTSSPHPYFDRIRETSPIHWNDRHRAWIVTRFADVAEGFRDDVRLTSNRIAQIRDRRLGKHELDTVGRSLGLIESWMLFQDNPQHRRLRAIVHKAFTPHVVAGLDAYIRELVEHQVGILRHRLAAYPGQPIDLLNEIAYEIPGPVICKMLGVPHEDRPRFAEWSEQMAGLIGGYVDDPDRFAKAHAAVEAMENYLSVIIERTSSSDGNLMARLVEAEADGERLTRDEAIAMGILVLFGGNRTTSCMIANTTRALLLHPEQLQLLCHNPKLVPQAVEEALRWEGHTKLTVRVVGGDFEWHGQQIRAGQLVFLTTLAANHDPRMFADPHQFQIERGNANRHIAFGTGIHLCLGMALARSELRIMLAGLLNVLPSMELVDAETEWLPTLLNRVQRRCLVRARST